MRMAYIYAVSVAVSIQMRKIVRGPTSVSERYLQLECQLLPESITRVEGYTPARWEF